MLDGMEGLVGQVINIISMGGAALTGASTISALGSANNPNKGVQVVTGTGAAALFAAFPQIMQTLATDGPEGAIDLATGILQNTGMF